ELDGRRVRLSRSQGEFFVLLCLMARMHELYRGLRRYSGFTAKLLDDAALAAFPRSVVPAERRKRAYWSSVLARAEVSSSYRPARKLWRRERTGHYLPSAVGVRVAGEPGREDRFVPLDELLALPLLEPELKRHATEAEPPAQKAAGG